MHLCNSSGYKSTRIQVCPSGVAQRKDVWPTTRPSLGVFHFHLVVAVLLYKCQPFAHTVLTGLEDFWEYVLESDIKHKLGLLSGTQTGFTLFIVFVAVTVLTVLNFANCQFSSILVWIFQSEDKHRPSR